MSVMIRFDHSFVMNCFQQQGRNVESESKSRASPLVEENLRKIIHEKDQEIAEIRMKKQMFEEEQMKKVILQHRNDNSYMTYKIHTI